MLIRYAARRDDASDAQPQGHHELISFISPATSAAQRRPHISRRTSRRRRRLASATDAILITRAAIDYALLFSRHDVQACIYCLCHFKKIFHFHIAARLRHADESAPAVPRRRIGRASMPPKHMRKAEIPAGHIIISCR